MTELVYQMMLSKSVGKNPAIELKKISRKAAKMMWAVQVIDEMFNTYVKARRLLD